MGILGIFLGFLLPGFFVDGYDNPGQLNEQTIPMYEKQMFNMLLFVACVATVISILVLVTFREKPGVPIFSIKSTTE